MAIKTIHPSKAPGPDGFSGHYYRKYQEILIFHLCSYFNDLRQGNNIPKHENAAYLPKPGKDHGDCANYCQISLINVDLDIMTKVLALRLNSFLPQYIHLDQTGFVPNRKASDQTRRIINLIEAVQSDWDHKGPRQGMLLSLDIQTAFDSLSWDYLLNVLHCFGFGKCFLSLLRRLYEAPMASLMLRGYSSQSLDIRRGTRQGYPLSPLLFALAIEPLAIKIRVCPDVRGIVCGDREHKCLLFADDLLLALSLPITSLSNLYAILQPFSEISGLKINHDKSRGLNLSLQSSTQRVLEQT